MLGGKVQTETAYRVKWGNVLHNNLTGLNCASSSLQISDPEISTAALWHILYYMQQKPYCNSGWLVSIVFDCFTG